MNVTRHPYGYALFGNPITSLRLIFLSSNIIGDIMIPSSVFMHNEFQSIGLVIILTFLYSKKNYISNLDMSFAYHVSSGWCIIWYKSFPEIIIPPLIREIKLPASRLNIQHPISVPDLVANSTMLQLLALLNSLTSTERVCSDIMLSILSHSCTIFLYSERKQWFIEN